MCTSYDIPKIEIREKKLFRKGKWEGRGAPAEPVAPSDRSLISEPRLEQLQETSYLSLTSYKMENLFKNSI
jgi:hypothetical protein